MRGQKGDFVEAEIEKQKALERGKSFDVPIKSPIKPAAHTPVYKMHRYYARRPWNVFAHLIENYSRPGDIILDPFCGGGVTVVEALRLRRRVIGVDLSPLAVFITKMEVADIDPDELKRAFDRVSALAREKIGPLYETACPKCGAEAEIEWTEWSNVYKCPRCSETVAIARAKKTGGAQYNCPHCNTDFKASGAEKTDEIPIRMMVSCPSCDFRGEKEPDERDESLLERLERDFDKIVKKEGLWYPRDEFPDGDLEKDHSLFQKGITHFYKLFTKRNLLANARLLKLIKDTDLPEDVKEFVFFAFSGSLRFTNKMVFISPNWQGGKPVEWAAHGYWLPDVFIEVSVCSAFSGRFRSILRGKQFSREHIGPFCRFAETYEDLRDNKTCLLLAQSSHQLPLPNNSIDVVITDPPFGGNVQYAELSDFWTVWLRDVIDGGLIDNTYEAIETRHKGFPTEKDSAHYENMLYLIFKECHRVLKRDGWMVLTFHNREPRVWMALHRAAKRAGFRLPSPAEDPNRGMVYQPPIKEYTPTFHQRAPGSMLGDFIISFKRAEAVPDFLDARTHLTTDEERALRDYLTDFINYHGGGLDDTTMMGAIVDFLSKNDLFHRAGSLEFAGFLGAHFAKKEGRWYTRDMIAPDGGLRPLDYVPAEEMIEKILVPFLKERGMATMDEVLVEVYSKLVNAHRPGTEAVSRVITRLCIQTNHPTIKNRKVFMLRGATPETPEVRKVRVREREDLFRNISLVPELGHNDVIRLLANYAKRMGYEFHIGETEQNKVEEFKRISTKMISKEFFGIPDKRAFDIIREIDLLLLRGNVIVAGIEVATTVSTAREAINVRFRELFTIMPNLAIPCFVIVKDEDFKKAHEYLNTKANIKDGIPDRVRLLRVSQLTESFVRELFKQGAS